MALHDVTRDEVGEAIARRAPGVDTAQFNLAYRRADAELEWAASPRSYSIEVPGMHHLAAIMTESMLTDGGTRVAEPLAPAEVHAVVQAAVARAILTQEGARR